MKYYQLLKSSNEGDLVIKFTHLHEKRSFSLYSNNWSKDENGHRMACLLVHKDSEILNTIHNVIKMQSEELNIDSETQIMRLLSDGNTISDKYSDYMILNVKTNNMPKIVDVDKKIVLPMYDEYIDGYNINAYVSFYTYCYENKTGITVYISRIQLLSENIDFQTDGVTNDIFDD